MQYPNPNPYPKFTLAIRILLRKIIIRNANSSKHKGTPSPKNITYTMLLKITFFPCILALSTGIKNVILEYSIPVYKTSALTRLTCPKENTNMSIHILPSCKYCNYIHIYIHLPSISTIYVVYCIFSMPTFSHHSSIFDMPVVWYQY